MRWDYVELIMAVDASFEIHISDSEANRMESAGDLHNVVTAKRANQQGDVWERLCVAIESTGIPREKITPMTLLRDLEFT